MEPKHIGGVRAIPSWADRMDSKRMIKFGEVNCCARAGLWDREYIAGY